MAHRVELASGPCHRRGRCPSSHGRYARNRRNYLLFERNRGARTRTNVPTGERTKLRLRSYRENGPDGLNRGRQARMRSRQDHRAMHDHIVPGRWLRPFAQYGAHRLGAQPGKTLRASGGAGETPEARTLERPIRGSDELEKHQAIGPVGHRGRSAQRFSVPSPCQRC